MSYTKSDITRYFTADEVKDAVCGETGEVATEIETRDVPYGTDMESIVRMNDDGKYYRINWSRSDDYLNGGKYPEVYPIETVNATVRTEYLTADEVKKYSDTEVFEKLVKQLDVKQIAELITVLENKQ